MAPITAAVLVAQTALILWLLWERRRRRVAELECQHRVAELAQAARVAAVGELISSITHEISQPLTSILSNASAGQFLIDSRRPPMGEIREILTAIRDEDVRASAVVRQLRELLGKYGHDVQPLDINDLIARVLRLVGGTLCCHGVSLKTEFQPHLPPVAGDAVHLQQVVLNLVMNAIEAMTQVPPGSRRLRVRTLLRHGRDVEVAISDTGPGISRDCLSKLFEPFYSTRDAGMGLGLSIARTAVRAHRGRIWAESGDAGATLRFTLPALEDALPISAESERERSPPLPEAPDRRRTEPHTLA